MTATLFETLSTRLRVLELWYDLAVRPEDDNCPLEDLDMLQDEDDDLPELKRRCQLARANMNSNLPPPKLVRDDELVPKPSTIAGAGLGLFYSPLQSNKSTAVGEILCYYSGHYHNMQSSNCLVDKSYLMLVSGDLLMDAGPCLDIKARYINDPLNEALVNCEFVPELDSVKVVTKRWIQPGEELFASYGDAYWSQQCHPGKVLYNNHPSSVGCCGEAAEPELILAS